MQVVLEKKFYARPASAVPAYFQLPTKLTARADSALPLKLWV